jgi:hypothetical protein
MAPRGDRLARLALFQHEPYCSRACGDGVRAALSPFHTIEALNRHDITPDRLASFDMVIFPGGHGAAEAFQTVLQSRKTVIKDFVNKGGAYLGICMGAYWADAAYFDVIGKLRVKRYIERPKAEIRRSFATVARVEWQGRPEKMFFFDGCTLTGQSEGLTVDATYANGDAMAVRIGRVGLIGCHPESQRDWYTTKAMEPYWHGGRHHRLLSQFVDTVLGKPKMDIEPDVQVVGNEAAEIERLKQALTEIEAATRPFTHGTLKQVNELALKSLRKSSIV